MSKGSIILNDETICSLKAHLYSFTDDAKLVLHIDNKIYRVQIGCNFEYQKENNIVMLLIGEQIV